MANAKLGTKAVGSIVKLKVNGTAKEFIVVHQGKPSSIYDESCNGTWLLMKDILEATRWHSSDDNNLENSTIHSLLNSTFLNAFEKQHQDAIKQVKIRTVRTAALVARIKAVQMACSARFSCCPATIGFDQR